MDTTETPTTEIVVIDEAVVVEDSTTDSFGKEITKTLVTSAATTAGLVVGMFVVGFAAQKVAQFKAKRASKNAEPEVHVVTDMPEKPETEKD